jgi:uncharacterized phiE125 gp8 family phage protein
VKYRSLTRATQPVVEPVTLTEAKQHLRVDIDDDNAYIMGLVSAARAWVEEYIDRTLVHTQWVMRMDKLPDSSLVPIELPRPPMATAADKTAVAVTFTYENGTTATYDSASLRVDRNATPGAIKTLYGFAWQPHLWDDNSVSVTWWGGYGEDGRSVPPQAKTAMLMLAAHWYESRSSVLAGSISKEIEFGVKSLLDSIKWGSYR